MDCLLHEKRELKRRRFHHNDKWLEVSEKAKANSATRYKFGLIDGDKRLAPLLYDTLISWRCPWMEPLVYEAFDSPDFQTAMPDVTPEEAESLFSHALRGHRRDPVTAKAPEDPGQFRYKDVLKPPGLVDYDQQLYGTERLLVFIVEALVLLQEEGDSNGKRGMFLWELPGFKKVQLKGLKGWNDLLQPNVGIRTKTGEVVLPQSTPEGARQLSRVTRAAVVPAGIRGEAIIRDTERYRYAGLGTGSMVAPKKIIVDQKLGLYLKPVPEPPYVTRALVMQAVGSLDPKTKDVVKNWWPTQMNAWANSIGETYAEHMIPISRWEKVLNEADPKFAEKVYRSLLWKKPDVATLGKAVISIADEMKKNIKHRHKAQAGRAEAYEGRSALEKISDFSTQLFDNPEAALDIQLPSLFPDLTGALPTIGAIGGGLAGLIVTSIPSWILSWISSPLSWVLLLAGAAGGGYAGYAIMSPNAGNTGNLPMNYRQTTFGYFVAPPTVAGTLGQINLPGAVPPPPAVNPQVYASNYSCSVPNIQTFMQPPCNVLYR